MRSAPAVLRPHEPVAERVLLPGDPGRALRLAQQLIDGPRMLNHHRGLWGYSGPAADGEPLTVQSTGLGGPSAAAVVAELVELGACRKRHEVLGRRSLSTLAVHGTGNVERAGESGERSTFRRTSPQNVEIPPDLGRRSTFCCSWRQNVA